MSNIQQVIRERNEALTELKTGHKDEHPGKMVYTPFGYRRYLKPREHYVPSYFNKHVSNFTPTLFIYLFIYFLFIL